MATATAAALIVLSLGALLSRAFLLTAMARAGLLIAYSAWRKHIVPSMLADSTVVAVVGDGRLETLPQRRFNPLQFGEKVQSARANPWCIIHLVARRFPQEEEDLLHVALGIPAQILVPQ